jgi:hypothetical protein
MTSQDAHLSSVPAGFPSPADDYKANKLDLDELVIHNPQATYYIRYYPNHYQAEKGIRVYITKLKDIRISY